MMKCIWSTMLTLPAAQDGQRVSRCLYVGVYSNESTRNRKSNFYLSRSAQSASSSTMTSNMTLETCSPSVSFIKNHFTADPLLLVQGFNLLSFGKSRGKSVLHRIKRSITSCDNEFSMKFASSHLELRFFLHRIIVYNWHMNLKLTHLLVIPCRWPCSQSVVPSLRDLEVLE